MDRYEKVLKLLRERHQLHPIRGYNPEMSLERNVWGSGYAKAIEDLLEICEDPEKLDAALNDDGMIW